MFNSGRKEKKEKEENKSSLTKHLFEVQAFNPLVSVIFLNMSVILSPSFTLSFPLLGFPPLSTYHFEVDYKRSAEQISRR